MKPVIAISIGDVGGIGPEIILKAFKDDRLFPLCSPVVFAPETLLQTCLNRQEFNLSINVIQSSADIQENAINVLPLDNSGDDYTLGHPSQKNGEIGIRSVKQAVSWCMEEKAVAMVTAPLSKESIGLAGSSYKGHTEFLRDLSDSEEVLMVLASQVMRIGLVTIHVPLAGVTELISASRIFRTLALAHHGLQQDFGISEPKIAVLALNPHAGDGGYIGEEEIAIIQPAIKQAQLEGINAEGPFSADGFFSAYGNEPYDMIVAMYHDQGLIPLKMSAGGKAVNISCGLPFVRTSPDHGTAFSIAGQGIADEGSMIEAVFSALRISENRKAYARGAVND
jgi:4-hydroxythreonine-4-phosphate dehydrogenase